MSVQEKHLAAYDRVMKVYEMNNDHYFKRTQILMIVIQSALFVSLAKVLVKVSSKYSADMGKMSTILKATPHIAIIGLFIGAVVAVLGILGAYAWVRMITCQHQRLELCRNYLRDIESKMFGLGIPLDFFQKEQRAFLYRRNVCFEGTNDFPSREMQKKEEIEGGVMEIEKRIAKYLVRLWILIYFAMLAGYVVIVFIVHTKSYQLGLCLAPVALMYPFIMFLLSAKRDRDRSRQCRACRPDARE